MRKPKPSVLIIEPNDNLAVPYMHLSSSKYHFSYSKNTREALCELAEEMPDLVFLSTSFNTQQIIKFLQQLKNNCKKKIVPLVFVIDLSQPLSVVPGTTWGKYVGIAHSLTDHEELKATLNRVLGK